MLEIAQDASAIKRRDIATHRRAPRKFGFCRECGVRFQAHRTSREFCCTECRQTFHNRAASRGAEIFHVLMAMRFDRAKATAAGTSCFAGWRRHSRLRTIAPGLGAPAGTTSKGSRLVMRISLRPSSMTVWPDDADCIGANSVRQNENGAQKRPRARAPVANL